MRPQSGQSASAFTAVVVVALFLVAGLVIDGGSQLAARVRAEHVAAAAVRVATDASATASVAGGGTDAGRRAAEDFLATEPDVDAEVHSVGGEVTVTTHIRTSTLFLSLIGITGLSAHASASGRLHA